MNRKFRFWNEEQKRMISSEEFNELGYRINSFGKICVEMDDGEMQYENTIDGILLDSLNIKDRKGNEIYLASGGIDKYKGAYYIQLGKYQQANGENHYGFYVKFIDEINKYDRKDVFYWVKERKFIFDKNVFENPEIIGIIDERNS